ncbi:hypothetical protein [Vineibacter terrae]|uniref:hypothetical protein n=1 Tax=Vineibacter terrae TaxID=2586908 RepID=UPI002E314A03|nr:hypothetical protein [Vineibacter terrae]HEX2890837.1 hypothetical protein [Vineibacter terrae]
MSVRGRSRLSRAGAVLAVAACVGFCTAARAETLELIGYAGVLGEWEVTASVTPIGPAGKKEFAGPLKMRHVGYCTQDGPEERTGEIRLSLAGSSRLTATLLVNGVECSYSGRQSDTYSGSLKCPDRRAVPLTLWLKQ